MRDHPARPFEPEEIDTLLRAAASSRSALRDVALLHVLADTGIRAGELCDLRVCDVNLTARTALVRHGKGGKSRQIAFGKATAQALWRYLRSEEREEGDNVFLGQRGEQLTRGALTQVCRRLGQRAGVSKVHSHRFRHHCACTMLRIGMHVFAVMMELGHSRVQVTERYVRLAESDVREAHHTASPMDNHKRRPGGRNGV